MHRTPNLFLIGAAKAGTSTLATLLSQHPQIQLGERKEPEFFSHHFEKGLDWYASNFMTTNRGHLLLDASTGYTRLPQYPHVAERICHQKPDAKLIYLMRHPVDRAYSHFIHRFTKELRYNSYFDTTFEEHIKKDPMCLDSSNYKLQIQEYLKYFRRDQLLLMFTHELRTDKMQLAKKSCEFIGVDFNDLYFEDSKSDQNITSSFIESRVRIKVTDRIKTIPGVRRILPYIPSSLRQKGYTVIRKIKFGDTIASEFTPAPMLATTRAMLIEEFRQSNDWVAELTGADLSLWNS